MCAPRKPGEGGSKEAETFESDPVRGDLPSSGQGRVPVGTECCARSGDGNAKRTQGARGPWYQPRKFKSRGGRRSACDGRQHPRAEDSVVPEDSSGVVEHGTCARGSPRNLGGPAVSTDRWYTRREEEPKRAWKGSRESERLVVPRRPGNSTREDPAEGRGRLVREPRRERCREHRSPTTSQRNKNG